MAGALGTIAKTVSEALGLSLYSVRPGLGFGSLHYSTFARVCVMNRLVLCVPCVCAV